MGRRRTSELGTAAPLAHARKDPHGARSKCTLDIVQITSDAGRAALEAGFLRPSHSGCGFGDRMFTPVFKHKDGRCAFFLLKRLKKKKSSRGSLRESDPFIQQPRARVPPGLWWSFWNALPTAAQSWASRAAARAAPGCAGHALQAAHGKPLSG